MRERDLEWRKKINLAIAISSSVVAGISINLFVGLWESDLGKKVDPLISLNLTQIKTELEMERLRTDQLFAAIKMGTNQTTIRSDELVELSQQLSNVTSRLTGLENAITASPEKSLAIPMLRKDLDTLEKTIIDQRAAIKGELERLYDFNKWFFGLIATMALSTVGIAVANAFKAFRKEAKEIAEAAEN